MNALDTADSNPRGWRMPVGVVMHSRPARRGRWAWTEWRAAAVVAGAELEDRHGRTDLPASGEDERVLYSGFTLELFPDAGRDYWYNLVSDTPSLYVVCEPGADESEPPRPVLVSAVPDEAAAHMETDDPVFTLPMPPVVHAWLERFVVTHYVPDPVKKRRRR